MNDVVTAILGGGQGTRLWPLTRTRAKPAVPVGGKFRLIDIPISNSLHAGVDRIYVLTQFSSASLHRHIAQTYRFDVFSEGFVNILAAEQTVENTDWFQGTADAVRKNLRRLTDGDPKEILILSGDQLYMMDLPAMIATHRAAGADFTVAVNPAPVAAAPALGIMRLDPSGRIVEFVEKPQDPAVAEGLALDAETTAALGLATPPGAVLASMGIYLFKAEVLRELLRATGATDFGHQIIPGAIHDRRVQGFVHDGYWRDIGTIGAFHEANLELTDTVPALNLYSPSFPFYTHPRFLPGCKVDRCEVSRSILCDGSIVSGGRISRSIVGIRGVVREGSELDQVVMMGATQFEPPGASGVALGVGRDCTIRRAIIDLDSRIGDGSRLVNEAGVEHADGPEGAGWCIRDGVIVAFRGGTIAPGTVV